MQYLLLAFAGGLVLPLQVGLNAGLAKALNNPLLSAFVSFVLGGIVLLGIVVAIRQPWPDTTTISSIPWWLWCGGILGAFYVSATIIAAPYIGAALLIGLVVAGQMLAALLLDHYGLAGFPQNSINTAKIIGATMIVAGVFLIRKS